MKKILMTLIALLALVTFACNRAEAPAAVVVAEETPVVEVEVVEYATEEYAADAEEEEAEEAAE